MIPRIIELPPADLLEVLRFDERAYVRLLDGYDGDMVKAAHQLATAKTITAGTGTVPTPAELHCAAVTIMTHLERLGAIIAEVAPTQRVLADDCRHLGLPVIGAPEDDT